MTKHFVVASVLLASFPVAYGADIDLQCEQLSNTLIERFHREGLLPANGEGALRAQEIAQDVCAGAEAQAQQQHEEGKKEALSNWLFESTGGKSGNKRLLNHKR